MDKVKVAVIGLGIMGQKHARVIFESHNEELVAVADINEKTAKDAASMFGVKEYFVDYKKMIKECDIDAVCIATPDFLHYEPVNYCMKAKKHVLVEKPLATTLEESRALMEAEKKTDKVIMVNYTHRWAVHYSKAKELIDQGALGDPVMVYTRKNDTIFVPTEMISWASNTSPIKFLASHDIDLTLWFLDTKVTEVFARGTKGVLTARGIDAYDAIQALVKFDNGAIGTFEASWIYPNTFPTNCDSYIQLIGKKGAITLDRRSENIEVATEEKYSYPRPTLYSIINNKAEGGFKCAHEHFIDCIVEAKKPVVTMEQAYSVAEVTVAIHESIESGKPVTLPVK